MELPLAGESGALGTEALYSVTRAAISEVNYTFLIKAKNGKAIFPLSSYLNE